MQWLVPLAMGVWAVVTWAHGQERERDRERKRITALYVNPFLSACEDLQSRIYKILVLNGLDVLRERYPDGCYAEETMYLLVRYFGWLSAVSRHGPYTQDPVVIEHTRKVRRAFSTTTSGHPVGAFNIFVPEQKALGKIVMQTSEGEHGHEFDTISFYEFKEHLANPPLGESHSIKQSLDALRNANNADDIPGRQRLAEAQSHIVDLLRYLEEREGYTLFEGKREKCVDIKKLPDPVSMRMRRRRA